MRCFALERDDRLTFAMAFSESQSQGAAHDSLAQSASLSAREWSVCCSSMDVLICRIGRALIRFDFISTHDYDYTEHPHAQCE